MRHIIQADFVGMSAAVTARGQALGITCSGTYGSSELYALMSLHDWQAPVAQRGLAGGVPLDPHIHIRVADPEDGRVLADNEPGELQVQGPNMLVCYLNNPEASAKAFTADGWFRTGDAGRMQEDGHLFIVDRLKDMIISGGENVYCTEVESVLRAHPQVTQVAVIGLPDPKWGEAVHAVVVLRAGAYAASPTLAEELRAHCQTQLAGYKCPRSFRFVAELPMSAAGKILKNVLRDQARPESKP